MIFLRKILIAICLLLSFTLWTVLVCFVDVQPIGPQNSSVGFATINGFVHHLTGINMSLYTITDWLGLVPVIVGLGFALLGLVQWIQRKNILKVDHNILVLGVFYIVVLAAYLLFEKFVVNYRPVLIEGFLEASYPSSTTLLVLCVMPTALLQFCMRMKNSLLRHLVSFSIVAFIAFMVFGRLLSGVHWISDIIGGALLSAGLVMLYDGVCERLRRLSS